ncbi:conserved hypothetical protein [Pediculus humanus corporis]|uniref:lysozyme n=1 Tax=Pediculus humanus subsp. corporis TaxID=121224 RepID=E0VE54_PEDHC|nr:uncharacterized protein Phum_PHUM128430 [Pediculus humanus corporis]EEB11660.1 conserved hypothetical protein [Pediculus humanus corporis]
MAAFFFGERLYDDLFIPDLTSACLGCICEATTNCNLTIGCSGDLCGPFFISKDYWEDSGSPVLYGDHPSRKGAYKTCVNDPYCAATTLKQYIFKYAQDCNGNGYLDCDDYARIHYLGGRQCSLPIYHYGYYKVFRYCQISVNLLN